MAVDQTAPGYTLPGNLPPEPDEPGVTPPSDNDSSKGIFSTMDNMSLFAMIFGFLAIGGLIARRNLAK